MKRTKFYSVLVAFVVAIFAAIAAAVAFAVPSKRVAKAAEGARVYKYLGITGPEDINRDEKNVYFGVSMPESIKPGDTFDVYISFLNRAGGVTTFTIWPTFSNGFTVNKAGTALLDDADNVFTEAYCDAITNSHTQTSAASAMCAMYDEDSGDDTVTTQSFIEILKISVTASDTLSPTDSDQGISYHMTFDWSDTSCCVQYVDSEEGLVTLEPEDVKAFDSEIVVKGLASEDVTMATGYPLVSANNVVLTGALGEVSDEYREDNETLGDGAPGIGGLRHTTYQSYDVVTKLSYSTSSLTVAVNANDSAATVKMLTNPTGDDSEGSEKYTVETNNTYTFDISELEPNVSNADDVEAGSDPIYETDESNGYYKYTLPYAYKVFAEAVGYVRVYSITFYKEMDAPEELPLTLNSVRFVSKDNTVSYDSSYDETTKTYTVLDANGTDPLTISYADAKQANWKNWTIVAERTYTGSEVTTTGDGIVTLKTGSNKFQLVISDGEDSETYFVEVNVTAANTDKSLTSVLIKNKNKPSEHFELIDKANTEGNVFTADDFAAEKLGETWMLDVTATKAGLVEITYDPTEKVLTAGVNYFHVKVTDQLGDYTDYTVVIKVEANADTSLDVFKAGDTDLVKDSAGNYSYKISDTVDNFYLIADAKEATSEVEVRNDGTLVPRVNGKYLIDINLSDTAVKQEITVRVSSEANTSATYIVVVTRLSSDATLKSVYIKNAANKTYQAVIDNTAHTVTISGLTYTDSLDATAWTLYVDANSAGAEYTKSKALTSFENNTITVTPETGEDDAVIYTVTISFDLSSDATLKNVYIKNAANKTYQAVIDNTAHTVTISGVTYKDSLDATAWTLYVEANSAGAEYTKSKALTSFENNEITVTPETGANDAVTYTVTINRIAGDENAALKVVYISDGTDSLIAVIDNDAKTCVINGMTYAQSLESWTMHVEAESPLAVYAATAVLTSLDGNKITVTPEKGAAVEYTVTINRATANSDTSAVVTVKAGNNDVELSVSGNTYTAVVNYDDINAVTVSVAVAELSTVKIDNAAATSKDVTLAVGDTTVVIEVTAEDGSVGEYSVIISAYTETASGDTETFIEISGDASVTLTLSEFVSHSYIVKDITVNYRVSDFTIVITVPEYITVSVAFGEGVTVTNGGAQTAAVARANGSNVEYTVQLEALKEGNNAIALEFTDTRTGVRKTFVQNVYRGIKPVEVKSNGGLVAAIVIFAILFVAVAVLLILTVLGILDLKKLFSKKGKKNAKSE